MIFLLFFTWLIYYGIKGVVIKEAKPVLLIITSVFWIFSMLIVKGMDPGFWKYYFIIYFIYSGIDYLNRNLTGKSIIELPYLSRVSVSSKGISILYEIPRILPLIAINIVSLVKKGKIINTTEFVDIEIKSAKNDRIKIKI